MKERTFKFTHLKCPMPGCGRVEEVLGRKWREGEVKIFRYAPCQACKAKHKEEEKL